MIQPAGPARDPNPGVPAGTRRLVLVAGEQAWGEAWVSGQLTAEQLSATLWVAESGPGGVATIPAAKMTQQLGNEHPLLVFNAHQGFHPDAFAAAVGTLRGGGDCVVLAPPLEDWPTFADPDKARFAAYPHAVHDMRGLFLERLARRWRGHAATQVVTQSSDCTLRVAGKATAVHLTAAQEDAVAAVLRVAHGHARRPLVLTADRGRGKSTVLGIAAARLLAAGLARVTVVAPHRAAVATLFRHALATAGLSGAAIADTVIGTGRLCFRLPSECTTDDGEALGLVLVDEAAAIPVALLQNLLGRSNRLVFASTVHGYEGSGRGFDLRFRSALHRHMPQWRALRLSAPVRWPQDDPLEVLVNDAFLLDAELSEIEDGAPLLIDKVEQAQLATSETLLRATFALLVNAHYQTRPSDLRQLLDNPDVHIWLARQGEAVIGALVATVEGGFDQAMAAQIVSGTRRPRGHLLPQSLAVHAGLEQVLGQRVLRVQRIAVDPRMQRRGIGRRLLEWPAAWAAGHQFDLLGCAFGADLPLLAFWQACGFRPQRIGVRVDPASAAHSLFMLRGLSGPGQDLAGLGERRFQAQLPWSLGASLAALDSRLAVRLLAGRDCSDLALSVADRRDLAHLAAGVRQPATAEALLWKAIVWAAATRNVDADRLAPLLAWQLQHRPADRVCRTFALAGRRALNAQLRAMVAATASRPPALG